MQMKSKLKMRYMNEKKASESLCAAEKGQTVEALNHNKSERDCAAHRLYVAETQALLIHLHKLR